jgi:hypothetical protein
VSPRCSAGAHRRTLDIIQLGAADPSLRHSGPHGLVLPAARELGHKLAFGGKSKEFLRRIHGLAFPVLVLPNQQNPKAFRRFLVEIDFVGRPPPPAVHNPPRLGTPPQPVEIAVSLRFRFTALGPRSRRFSEFDREGSDW